MGEIGEQDVSAILIIEWAQAEGRRIKRYLGSHCPGDATRGRLARPIYRLTDHGHGDD